MVNGFKTEKWLKALIFAGLLVLVSIIFSQKVEFTAVDLGRHVENGKILWTDARVLSTNLYSYTEPDTRFINHHWLSGLIYYFVYLVGGFNLLSILNIIIILAAFILAFKIAKKKAGFYIPALVSIPVIYLMSERVEIRPEIFSYFFLILTWYILDKAEESKKPHLLYWLVPLFLVWVNIHIYFFIGLILIGIKIAAKFLPALIETQGDIKKRLQSGWLISKNLIMNFGLVFIACLFNPNFIRGLFYPFNILRNYGYEIAENKSVFYLENLMVNSNITIFKYLLFLLILSFVASFFFSKKINYFNLFIGIFFSLLALFAVRNLAIFALISLILVSINLKQPLNFLKDNISVFTPELQDKYRLYLVTFFLLLVLSANLYLIVDANKNRKFIKNTFGWGLLPGSEDSIKFYNENKLSGPIFNNYDLGSALIFWLYPQEKVFVDNRPEAYLNSFFNDIYRPMQMQKNKWLEYSSLYKFKTVYFSHTDFTPWAQAFLGQTIDNTWGLVYFDRYTVILLNKKNNDAETIKKLVLSPQQIRARLRDLAADSDFRAKLNLASFASLIRQPDLAVEIYQDMLFSDPENALVLSSLGGVYANSQDRNDLMKARDFYVRGLEGGFKLPGLYNQIGLIDWRLGEYSRAEENWHSALKLERKNTSALYYLNQIETLRLQGSLK